MNKSINLYPTPPAEWLWRDHQEDIKREFHPSVTIPSTDEPLWHECTDMAKVDYEAWWEREHPQPEPVEPTIHLEPTEPSPEPSESDTVAGVVEPEQSTSAEQEGGEG